MLRQQHGHHDLCRSLSVLSFAGSSYCPPLPLLSAPTSAFSIPLDIKFGGFFCIFEVFCTLIFYSLLPPFPSVSSHGNNAFVPSVRDGGTNGPRYPHFPALPPSPGSSPAIRALPQYPYPHSLDKYIYIVSITLLIKYVLIMRCDQSKEGPDTGLLDLDRGVREGRDSRWLYLIVSPAVLATSRKRKREELLSQMGVWLGEYYSGEGSELWVYVSSTQGVVPGWGGWDPDYWTKVHALKGR